MMSTQMQQQRASTSNANHSQMSKSGGFQQTKKNYQKKISKQDEFQKSATNLVSTSKIVGTKSRPYKAQTRPQSNQKKNETVTPMQV